MAGYQTIEALRPILHRGPVAMPVVNRDLVRPPKPLTEVQKRHAEMQALRAEGLGARAIAKKFGVSRGAVQWATRKMNVPEGGWPTGGKPSRINLAKAQRMRRAGFTYAEIAEDFGCSESNAHKLLTGYKCRVHSVHRPTRNDEEMVSRATKVPARDLVARNTQNARLRSLCKARDILFWLVRERRPSLSYDAVGRWLGGFHATTVMHGAGRCRNVAERIGVVCDPSDPKTYGEACRLLWREEW